MSGSRSRTNTAEERVRRTTPEDNVPPSPARGQLQESLSVVDTVTALVRGWSADEARAKVSAEYAPTLTKIWVCWTPAVLYAFGWLPKHQQSVFFAGFGFCWNVVLSLISNPQSHRDRLRVSKTERT